MTKILQNTFKKSGTVALAFVFLFNTNFATIEYAFAKEYIPTDAEMGFTGFSDGGTNYSDYGYNNWSNGQVDYVTSNWNTSVSNVPTDAEMGFTGFSNGGTNYSDYSYNNWTNGQVGYVTTGCGSNCYTVPSQSSIPTDAEMGFTGFSNGGTNYSDYNYNNWTNGQVDYVTTGCTTNCGTTYVPADWSNSGSGSTLFVSPAVYNTTPISYNTGSYLYTPYNWYGNTGSSWYNTPVYRPAPVITPVVVTPAPVYSNNNNVVDNRIIDNRIIDNSVCSGANNCNTNTNTMINNPAPYPNSTPISYPCSYNGQTYYNINDFNLYCKAPVTSYYCSINGQTYYNLNDYNAYCKASPVPVTYYCSINGQTYYNLSDYNTYCKSQTYYCSYNGYYYNTQYEFNTLCKAPVSLYCALNGTTYYNTTDYSNGCKKYCTQNGYYYATQYDYDNYCRVPVTNFYCSINGYTYKDVYDFNNYCKVVNNQYYCNLNGRTYGNPSDYNFYCKNVSYTHRVVTTIPTNIGEMSGTCNAVAMMGGNVNSTGYFEYGTSYSLGKITNSANVGNVSNTSYSNTITGLTPNTTYYCRAVMTNKDGTYRGEIMSFKTSAVKVKYVTEVITKKAVKQTTKTTAKSNKGGDEVICKDVKGNTDVISANKNLVSFKLGKLGNVQAGKVTEYVVKYENTSRIGLTNLKLKVSLPKDMKFVSTSFGSYDEYTNSLTITLGNLASAEARDIRFAAMNSASMQAGATNVINSLISYEVLDEKGEAMTGEVTNYTIVTSDPAPVNINNANNSKDAKETTSNMFPNTLIEWLVIIILIAILVVLGRNIYNGIVGEKRHDAHDDHKSH